MNSALVTVLFLGLVTAQNIVENVRANSTVVYPMMLPKGFVVTASMPQVEQAGPNMRCDERKFCFEAIPAAMGAYVKGVMEKSVTSAVFTGKGNSRGFGVAFINQNSPVKDPSYPNKVHGQSKLTLANGTELLEIYRFNRKAGKIEAFDNMTAVNDLSSQPVLGLYSPLLLPPKEQDYNIVIVNIPNDTNNYTLTFKLSNKTNRTYYFKRQSGFGVFVRGWQDIYFEAPDNNTIPTTAPTTTSGAYRVFPFMALLMACPILVH